MDLDLMPKSIGMNVPWQHKAKRSKRDKHANL